MKYAIDYRDMHTAIHGLILFKSTMQAENNLKKIKVAMQSHDNAIYTEAIGKMEDDCFTWIEDLDFHLFDKILHDVKYKVNENGRVYSRYENVTIINYEQSIDLY